MPKSVIFLISDSAADTASNDNHLRLPKAFTNCGWQVAQADPQRLRISPDGLSIDGYHLSDADLVWPLGFGARAGFLDRAHLLSQLPQAQLVTPIAEQVLAHGKAQWAQLCAPTYISNDSAELQSVAQNHGGEWVIKPLAGSYGRGVHHVIPSHYSVINSVMDSQQGAYFVLQRFIPEIVHGEIRTLVAGGKIIGSYRRKPQQGIRANLAADGLAFAVAAAAVNQTLLDTVMDGLRKRRIGYAAIDTAGSYLMEVNLANPGGLGTLSSVYKQDFGPAVVAAISAQHGL